MNCAILAIGTELCLGQITNRNASWLAQSLHELGLSSPWHRVVPDDRELIIQELNELSNRAEILIVTGGLGPTTDDFTRDCVSEFLGRPLVWHEASWQWINDRLGERGIRVRDLQKQQCYYPQGATVMQNDRGTAHGFRIELLESETQRFGKLSHLFVLPGPPLEVASVFKNGVEPVLLPLQKDLDPIVVRSWDCLGRGESEVAHKVEAVLEGCPFEKAYRVHLPFVEFKLSYRLSQAKAAQDWCTKVEEILGDWIALRDGQDAAALCFERIHQQFTQPYPQPQISIYDEVTEGLFLERLARCLKGHVLAGKVHLLQAAEVDSARLTPIPASEITLGLKRISATEAEARLHFRGQNRRLSLRSPYRGPMSLDRQKQFFIESAFLFWAQEFCGSQLSPGTNRV